MRATFVRLLIADRKDGSAALPSLEISSDHMIFTAPDRAIMAGSLVPGNTVLLQDGTTNTKVIATKLVESTGSYALHQVLWL